MKDLNYYMKLYEREYEDEILKLKVNEMPIPELWIYYNWCQEMDIHNPDVFEKYLEEVKSELDPNLYDLLKNAHYIIMKSIKEIQNGTANNKPRIFDIYPKLSVKVVLDDDLAFLMDNKTLVKVEINECIHRLLDYDFGKVSNMIQDMNVLNIDEWDGTIEGLYDTDIGEVFLRCYFEEEETIRVEPSLVGLN